MHDLCVRCVKGYDVRGLTGTDAQIERPYRAQLGQGAVGAEHSGGGRMGVFRRQASVVLKRNVVL